MVQEAVTTEDKKTKVKKKFFIAKVIFGASADARLTTHMVAILNWIKTMDL